MKSLLIICLISVFLVPANSVMLKLKSYAPVCLSADLDSHKTVVIQASMKPDQHCEVELLVQTNTQYNIMDNIPYKRKSTHIFNCQKADTNRFMQKFVQEQQSHEMMKLRVCVTSRLMNPVVIDLSIKDLVSPDFHEIEDESLSLVSSKQLIELRQRMHGIKEELAKMQPMGEKYIETQEKIYNAYIEQKQKLNLVVKIQIGLIILIGIVWVLGLNALRKQTL